MVDISHLFGGEPFNGSDGGRQESPEEQLKQSMLGSGIEPPDRIIFDGEMHRFDTSKKGDNSGWYIVHSDNVPAGAFGDWKTDTTQNWCANIGRELTALESMANSRFLEEAKKKREAEKQKRQESTAIVVSSVWGDAGLAEKDHPYLTDHKIEPHGAKVSGDGRLIVPIYDEQLTLTSLQYIDQKSGKQFQGRGKIDQCFWWLGDYHNPNSKNVYVAEGYATACAVFEATGDLTLMAYSAHNLPAVTRIAREKHPEARLVIVADNDKSGLGEAKASQGAAVHGARVVVPPKIGGEPTDACDYAKAGGDLKDLLQPKDDGWLIPADEFAAQPAPLRWLVKRWIPRESLVMVHGPSGVGKSFVVLDMCLAIASGLSEWHGRVIRSDNVVYLAGEGHHGLKGRVAAWKQHHQVKHSPMWLSRTGCDLDTPAGLARVRDALINLPKPPALVVVDTLHRFLSGDENSSQDTKKMMDACGQLMSEFKCCVLLVHHTGVAEGAQQRARGSSAWKGALDVEISISKKRGEPIKINQIKQKDVPELGHVWSELKPVEINGWIDEDGEQVSSALAVEEVEPPKVKDRNDKKTKDHLRTFERAWWATGHEDKDGAPYISRSAFKEFLSGEKWTDGKIKAALRPDEPNRLIGGLLQREIIATHEHGWIVIDEGDAGGMMTRKMGEG